MYACVIVVCLNDVVLEFFCLFASVIVVSLNDTGCLFFCILFLFFCLKFFFPPPILLVKGLYF